MSVILAAIGMGALLTSSTTRQGYDKNDLVSLHVPDLHAQPSDPLCSTQEPGPLHAQHHSYVTSRIPYSGLRLTEISATSGNELRAITALPAPHVESWAFSMYNDQIFNEERVAPDEWMQRGLGRIQAALATI